MILNIRLMTCIQPLIYADHHAERGHLRPFGSRNGRILKKSWAKKKQLLSVWNSFPRFFANRMQRKWHLMQVCFYHGQLKKGWFIVLIGETISIHSFMDFLEWKRWVAFWNHRLTFPANGHWIITASASNLLRYVPSLPWVLLSAKNEIFSTRESLLNFQESRPRSFLGLLTRTGFTWLHPKKPFWTPSITAKPFRPGTS